MAPHVRSPTERLRAPASRRGQGLCSGTADPSFTRQHRPVELQHVCAPRHTRAHSPWTFSSHARGLPEPARMFDLPEHRFDDGLAPAVHVLPRLGLQLASHTLRQRIAVFRQRAARHGADSPVLQASRGNVEIHVGRRQRRQIRLRSNSTVGPTPPSSVPNCSPRRSIIGVNLQLVVSRLASPLGRTITGTHSPPRSARCRLARAAGPS